MANYTNWQAELAADIQKRARDAIERASEEAQWRADAANYMNQIVVHAILQAAHVFETNGFRYQTESEGKALDGRQCNSLKVFSPSNERRPVFEYEFLIEVKERGIVIQSKGAPGGGGFSILAESGSDYRAYNIDAIGQDIKNRFAAIPAK